MGNSNWQDLTIAINGIDPGQLLLEWHWLLPQNALSPLWLSMFGDWMLRSSDGQIYFLDALEGSLSAVAPSESALHDLLEVEENQNLWLMADWVKICQERKLLLSVGECYGWKVAPIIGGKFEFPNIQVFYLNVYESIMGQLHRQVQGLPRGTDIAGFKIIDE